MPYQATYPLKDQVTSSILSSLQNLRPETSLRSTLSAYIDSVILHSPLPTIEQTIVVWKALEYFVPNFIRGRFGIANTDLLTLHTLCSTPFIKVRPSFVQNRFHPDTGYDVEIRKYCREKKIVYQAFWTLTANPELVRSEVVGEVAEKVGVERAVGLYACK